MMAVCAVAQAPAGRTAAHGRAGQGRWEDIRGGVLLLAWMGGVWLRQSPNVFRGASMPAESLSGFAVCVDAAAHGRVGKAADGSRIHICERVQGSEFTFLNSES